MSTLSGNATKGEKGKKFQQLKIFLPSGSKSAEPEQQPNKSSAQRIQHGMTSLGKVPTARRPTNLPSEKSEQSGNDPSVNLVPSGGPGWGNKANETGPTTSSAPNANPPTSVSVNSTSMPGTSQPVQHVQHYPPTPRMPPMATVPGHVPVHHGHPDAKTWARMTLGGDSQAGNLFTPQSPLFHHEFPSLSSNAETTTASSTHATATVTQKPATNSAADTQYGPGPSLRPQTVSWMSGSRPQGSMGPAAGNLPVSAPAPVRPTFPPQIGPDGARNNLAPSGVGVVPAGPYHPPVMSDKIPPQYSALMPPFMLGNSYPGAFPPGVGPRPPYRPYISSGQHGPAERYMQPPTSGANSNKRSYDDEDVKIRSIIKEEDLNEMVNIGHEIGWAGHEDIDYNVKLKFSDDEDDDKNKEGRSKTRNKTHQASKPTDKPSAKKESDKENDPRNMMENLKDREKLYPTEVRNVWQVRKTMVAAAAAARYQIAPTGRMGEDEEDLQERRKQKKDEIDAIIQRAKERREEEERRYQEQLQHAANLKLRKLDERILAERKLENKDSHHSDIDMLPEWEKEKIRAQSNQNNEESKKVQTATPVPVVKDASEFRALTQLGDRSVFTKKERESANSNYSRSFTNNVPPRFQNLNRQNSSGSTSNSTSSQNLETRKNSLSQFSNKSNSPSFSSVRHMRLDSDSLSDKDRDWNQEDVRKERFISDDRPSERFQRDGNHSRDYNYERESDDDRKFSKEYDSDSKRKFYDKGDYSSDSYNREYDRDSSYSVKIERKNSESERSDKSRDYDGRRYSENEGREKTPPTSWRQHDDSSSEKSRQHFVPRSPRNFSDNESHERKKSRDEGSYEKTNFNNERDREYHRKEIPSRQPKELDREKEQDYREMFVDHKNMDNSEAKRSLEGDKREKDSERKSPSTHDDRPSRNDLRDARYSRESRESLRDDTYTIQEERSFSWVNETEVVEEKPVLRREHYREERGGDRYSHAQRHPPGPITREKLEAKELEDSKRNLTALVRSDKKTDAKRSEAEDKKEKEKTDAANSESASNSSHSHKQEEAVKSVWNKDDKKDKESKSSTATGETATDNKENKEKDDAKESSKSTSKHDEQSTKNHEDKRSDRNKSKNERAPKRDVRNNWARHPVYRGNPYGGRLEPKSLRQGRPLGKASSRRDSKFSESDYSDEISGSGREDRMSRNDRDDRPMKSKRYDRDDRNMDYRMDREYMGGGGRGRMRDYAYNKPSHRGRGGFRGSVGVGKRMDGYGPPPSKSPFGSQGGYPEERRMKGSRDSNNSQQEHHNASEKRESHSYDKSETADSKSSTSSRQQNDNDKNWKKNDNVQDNKSTVSSPTSVQTTEANEESFATASEGSDSEDNVQLVKNKPSFTGTKRQATVVAAKPQRRNYRSTSRKRPEGRRTAPLYSSRKDSGSYSSGKRSTAGGSSGKSSMSNKENEKYSNETNSENSYAKESEVKSVEKPRREYGDSQTKKSVKSRNSSNSRKSTRTGVVSSGRSKNAEVPARGLGKPKKNYDSKNFSDRKESKVDIPVPLFKELGPPIPAPPPTVNAWDKPITGALRTGSPSINAATSVTVSTSSVSVSATNNSTTVVKEKSVIQITEQHTESSPQSDLSPSSSVSTAEKVTTKVLENLDGSSPPVQTIIFENTNFKSGPSELNSKSKYTSQLKSHRYEKDMKLESLNSECANVSNFSANSSNSELPNNKHDALQMSLSFTKNEDASDMKLEFFDSEISKLTEDNKSAKTMELTHAIPIMQSSTAADLNLKIASVKKVWDGSFPEHFDDKYDGVMVNPGTSFPQPFSCHGSDSTNGPCYVNAHVDSAGHVQIDEVSGLGHNEVVYSPVSQIQGVNSSYGSAVNCQTVVIKNDSTSSSSNVCKVKPQPQGTNIPIVAQQSVGMSATLVSQPPPMSSPSYTFSCSTPQPNLGNNTVSATALAQMNYQYSSMPPVPSPPVLYNSSQTAAAPPTGLYQTYQIDNTQVAARSQFGQYPSYGLSGAIGQTSAFNQQSLFVQPPPNAPPPEIYPAAMTGFRLQPQPFGNTQQITSPSTVLISSTSNSLMSATVKPSNQQIGAIGTKTGFTTAQTSQQVFIPFEQASQILPPNFMAGNQLLQRPAGSVLPAASLQASTSFYNTGSGAGQTGFYQPGTNSHLQPQPGTAIGLTTFNAQSATASLGPAAIQNFGSQLTQQFRSAQATSYLKGSGNPCNIPSDFGNGKAIALSNQHDQLFPAGNQMSSTKARIPSGGKSVQNVQQAMGQHTMPPNSYNYPPANQMRNNGGASKGSQYPHPIQRPVSQGNNSNRSGNANSSSASHRMPVRNNSHQLVNNIQQQPPSSVYYTPSSGYSTGSSKLETSQLDSKSESNSDSKLADSIKTINSKNVTVSSSEKTAATNE